MTQTQTTCFFIWPSNQEVCGRQIIRCEDFPKPDESIMMSWSKLYGNAMWQKAKDNPEKFIYLSCGSIYPPSPYQQEFDFVSTQTPS